jgi:hypothetical protein
MGRNVVDTTIMEKKRVSWFCQKALSRLQHQTLKRKRSLYNKKREKQED